MPTVITVPIGQRDKSIKFGAAYSPSLSFNPDKKLLVGCSGLLAGMGVTVNTGPVPAEITVDPGAFIQRGIIVNVTSSQLVQFPGVPTFPLFLVAENANEVFNSSVQYLFTTTPAADSCIIASWPVGPITAPEIPIHISNCGLAEAISALSLFVVQHDRQVAAAAQTVFTLPPAKAYVVGANKLQVYRNGKKLVVNDEYAENTPTQFSLNFPAVLGDIFDLIVFKGSPPITSIALTDLTDVTTNLANAIKDPSTLRAATASQANPLATLADIPGLPATFGPNRLINSGFRFAQRQDPAVFTTYSALGIVFPWWIHAADRWAVSSETAALQYKRVDTGGDFGVLEANLAARYYGTLKKITSPGKIMIMQIPEASDIEDMRGKIIRFQVKMKFSVAASMKVRLGMVYSGFSSDKPSGGASFITAWGGGGVDPTLAGAGLTRIAPTLPDGGTVVGNGMDCLLTGGWVRYSACFLIPANARNIIPTIWSDAGLAISDELNISEASLTLGQGIPTWEPRLEQAELSLCQRYFCKSFNVDTPPHAGGPSTYLDGTFIWGATSAGAVATHSPKCNFPVRMRPHEVGIGGQPTVVRFNPFNANSQVLLDRTLSDCSASTHNVDFSGVIFGCTANPGTIIGDIFEIQWTADSEIIL